MSAETEADALIAQFGLRGGPGTKCQVGVSPHRDLIDALIAKGASDARIRAILRDAKQSLVGEGSIQRHRAGGCKCANPT